MNSDDGRLVLRAQAGEIDAFSQLVEIHWTRLVRLARSVIGDLEAEDCVQDALVTAWRKLPGLKIPEALPVWLMRITARRCIRRARCRRILLPLQSLMGGEEPTQEDTCRQIDVEWILGRLAPRQRAVMHLTIIEGMTDMEISAALHITAASVRSHRRRARDTLQKLIPNE